MELTKQLTEGLVREVSHNSKPSQAEGVDSPILSGRTDSCGGRPVTYQPGRDFT